jgi:tRNA pseudouridine13 synthase
LENLNVEQQRRALRLAVGNLTWEYSPGVLALRFRLTRGAFATAVIREIASTTNDDGDSNE